MQFSRLDDAEHKIADLVGCDWVLHAVQDVRLHQQDICE